MPSIITYDIGDKVRLGITFENGDTPADPTTGPVFEIKTPDAVITTYTYPTDSEIVRSSAGVFYFDFVITDSGNHFYRWSGEGLAHGAEEHQFVVREKKVQ